MQAFHLETKTKNIAGQEIGCIFPPAERKSWKSRLGGFFIFEHPSGPEVKPRRWTIGRGAYFGWWVVVNALALFCAWVISNMQTKGYVPGFDVEDVGKLEFCAIAALPIALVIRFITVILRLRDIDGNLWLTLAAFVPVGGLIMDAYLIFKPGSRTERSKASIIQSKQTLFTNKD